MLFYNDSYYNDLNATANFSAVNVKINIPKIVNITHDDCISVETIYNGGTVKTYIDGRLIDTSKVVDKYFVLCLEQYLKKDSQKVKVVYENGKIKREKTQSISIVYDFDLLSSEYFTYGEDNIIEIILPDTLNNKLLTVEINGTKYAFKRPAYAGNNIIEINISKLQAGNYSMHISYPGDDRFEAKNEIINFTVNYNIISPDYVEYKDTSFVYLNLPEDAAATWDNMWNLGSQTLDKAATVKLTRTLAIIPITLALSFITQRGSNANGEKFSLKRALPLFVVLFVLASIITTISAGFGVDANIFMPLKDLSKFLIIMAMGAIGLNTDVVKLVKSGGKPILLGLACWVAITIVSLALQNMMGIW